MNILFNLNISTILFIGLFVRVGAFLLMPNLFFPDSGTYLESGRELFLNGEIKAHNVMPLHPLIVGTLDSLLAIKFFNIFISTLSIFLLYRLSFALFSNRKIAVLSALMMAFYPFFVFYSVTSLTETLYVFLILGFLLALHNKKIVLGSILIVLSILLRPTLDLLAPLLIFIFSYFLHNLTIKNSLINVSKYALIYIILMSPWWYHQYEKYDQFVRLNLGDGIVLYSGNNDMNKSGGGVSKSEKGADMDLSRFDHINDPIEENNAMKQAAYDFIINNPKRFIELAGLKFIRFWRLWPYASDYEKPMYIAISLLSYGVVLLLSIFFLLRLPKSCFKRVLPMLAIIVYFSSVHMVLVGSIRYRLPIEPFLLIFSSFFIIDKIYQHSRNERLRCN